MLSWSGQYRSPAPPGRWKRRNPHRHARHRWPKTAAKPLNYGPGRGPLTPYASITLDSCGRPGLWSYASTTSREDKNQDAGSVAGASTPKKRRRQIRGAPSLTGAEHFWHDYTCFDRKHPVQAQVGFFGILSGDFFRCLLFLQPLCDTQDYRSFLTSYGIRIPA